MNSQKKYLRRNTGQIVFFFISCCWMKVNLRKMQQKCCILLHFSTFEKIIVTKITSIIFLIVGQPWPVCYRTPAHWRPQPCWTQPCQVHPVERPGWPASASFCPYRYQYCKNNNLISKVKRHTKYKNDVKKISIIDTADKKIKLSKLKNRKNTRICKQ